MSLNQLATDVLNLLKAGRYVVDGQVVRLADEQNQAVQNTCLYTPDRISTLSACDTPQPVVRIVDGTTQKVAHDLATGKGHLGLLNFASARNPGGGFLNGAKAQEEDLCRCSGLYPCLLQCMDYYEANRGQSSLLYTDHAIFSPKVPFFKTSGTGELLPAPFLASVITMPAPNSGPFLDDNPKGGRQLEETFLRRWENVLRVARDQGVTKLILGAWGCGAFRGDPLMASKTARQAIIGDGGKLDEIVFAIPNRGRQSQANYAAFQSTFQTK